MTLADVQSEIDSRGIGLDEVGISGLRYPVSVFDAEHGKQDTVATVALSVSLPPEQKGSHLSRFVEVIDDYAGELTPQTIPRLLRSLQERLESPTARLQASFPYFVRRHAPISKGSALIDYSCGFAASVRGDQFHLVLSAGVPVTSVCPCSKAISDYGAHNQRGYLTIDAVPATNEDGQFASIWMEDLIDAAEASASSPCFPFSSGPTNVTSPCSATTSLSSSRTWSGQSPIGSGAILASSGSQSKRSTRRASTTTGRSPALLGRQRPREFGQR